MPEPVDHLRAAEPLDPLLLESLDALRREGGLRAPLPGCGDTARRFRVLAGLGRLDLCLAKIVEAHLDADAILAELTGERAEAGRLWAVWAAEPPDAVVTARRDASAPGGWRVDGRKAWCSGAAVCTHALITAASAEGPVLMAIELADPGAQAEPPSWAGPGMARAGTTALTLRGVPALAVGGSGQYLSRPGFWIGAIGVAAVWLGGAAALADPLLERGRAGRLDAHGLAHLGAVDAALTGAWALLEDVAARIDATRVDAEPAVDWRADALRARAVVEDAVALTLARTARALGPGPFAADRRYALAAADLPVYVRQSHAERDLAQLGEAVAAAPAGGSASPRW